MPPLENMNGQDTNQQQDVDYQQPLKSAANDEQGKQPNAAGAPAAAPDAKLELTDAEVASKSVEELDKLIQQATQKKDGARRENAEPPKPKESEAPKGDKQPEKPAIKVKTPEGEDREIRSLEEAQKFNGRLTNELGASRKENEELKARLRALEMKVPEKPAPPAETPEQKKAREQELQDKVLVDPKGVIKQVLEETEAEKREAEQKRHTARLESVKYIKERHPEILDQTKGAEIANSVVEHLAASGYTQEEINYIKRDPFGALPPELLDLYITIGKQKAKIKTLESSAGKGTQQDIVSKINAAANGQSIIAKSGQGVPPVRGVELSDAVVNSMSVEEIDKKLNEYGKV